MHLEELPTEILYAISQDIAAFGSVFGESPLVGLTRASRALHAVSNPILYSTDVQESGGLRSMRYGLRTGLSNVVTLCLSAGADPNLRFESRQDLDSFFGPISRVASHRAGESSGAAMDFPVPDSHLEDGRIAHSPSPSEDSDDDIFNLNSRARTIRNIPFQSEDAFYWTPLHVAATRDDIKLLSLLLDHGANPNSAGRGVCICHCVPLRRTFGRSIPFGQQDDSEVLSRRLVTRWSPLHVAVCKGSLDCAEELVQRFGQPHAIESDEAVIAEAKRFFEDEPTLDDTALYFPRTFDAVTPRFDPLPPLHVAAGRFASVAAFERVYAILEKAGCLEGPGVDVLDAFGDTPFAVAAFSGRIGILGSFLRDHGADINFALRDLDGSCHSVFNALCKSGRFRDALLLMDLGVDINRDAELCLGDQHASALHHCCRHGVSRNGWTTTQNKLKQREAIMLIKRLIHAGVDINARAEGGTTGLMIAAHLGFTDAVRELLHAKADVGAEDDDGDYALRHAVARGLSLKPGPELDGALLTMQLLLDHGADPNQRSEKRGPPLFTRQYDLVGSPAVDLEAFNGRSTPFDIPRSSMVSIAPLLINNGADPNIYLKDPRDIGGGSLGEQLENLGGRSLAVSAFYLRELDSLNSLVASGTVVTLQDYLLMMRSFLDPDVQSPGSKAAAVEALFRILNCPSILESPKDRRRIMDAWTEVLYLAVGSRPRLVNALAPHICLTNMCGPGPGGKTVLHLMAQWERKIKERPDQFEQRITEMMINLLRCGADRQIDQPDNSGRSPLHLAVDRGNIAVARQLVRWGASLHIEHKKPDGSTTISPLRSAIRSYSKASQFRVATNILEASSDIHGSTDRLPENLGLLKDLILHFGGHPFDKPARMEPRTTGLMEKFFAIGVSVNEADEHGNTALHHLIQLLYPSDGRSKDSEDQGVYSSHSSSFALSSIVSADSPPGTGPERLFELSAERDMHLNGHNLIYESDSDYDFHPDNYDQPEYDIFDDDSEGSDDIEYAETAPTNELGELVNHDPRRVSDRCDTWMSSFFLLLVSNASLTARNHAGKTALDYIDELIGCQPPACPKMYSQVIHVLRELVKRPPFDPELLAKLDESDIKVKGRPLLIVHDQIHISMDENGLEEAHELEHKASAGGETCWTPFW